MGIFLYFDTAHAIHTHDFLIQKSGGIMGIKDAGHLDSIIDQIQNDWYYPEFEDKLTHLVFSVNKGHCFSDGNKRSSIALGAYFLEINGLDFCVTKFMIEMENIAVDVADNRIDKELLGKIIFSIINEEDYNEALKVKIVEAKSGI